MRSIQNVVQLSLVATMLATRTLSAQSVEGPREAGEAASSQGGVAVFTHMTSVVTTSAAPSAGGGARRYPLALRAHDSLRGARPIDGLVLQSRVRAVSRQTETTRTRGQNARRGAAIGGIVGFVSGAIIGSRLGTGCNAFSNSKCSTTRNRIGLMITMGTGVGVVGAGTGALIGSALPVRR